MAGKTYCVGSYGRDGFKVYRYGVGQTLTGLTREAADFAAGLVWQDSTTLVVLEEEEGMIGELPPLSDGAAKEAPPPAWAVALGAPPVRAANEIMRELVAKTNELADAVDALKAAEKRVPLKIGLRCVVSSVRRKEGKHLVGSPSAFTVQLTIESVPEWRTVTIDVSEEAGQALLTHPLTHSSVSLMLEVG